MNKVLMFLSTKKALAIRMAKKVLAILSIKNVLFVLKVIAFTVVIACSSPVWGLIVLYKMGWILSDNMIEYFTTDEDKGRQKPSN